MKLYVMRHGETDGNKIRLLQGRLDNPLNENGRKQAAEAGSLLRDIPFDAYYVSPLTRTMETAELATGKPRSAFFPEERIIEISFGSQEGRTLEELGPEFGRFFLDPEHYEPVCGAESFPELTARIGSFLEELKEKPYQNVLAVSHGAAIHALLLVVEKRELSTFWQQDIGNCGLTELTLINGEWQVTKPCETRDLYYGKEVGKAFGKG